MYTSETEQPFLTSWSNDPYKSITYRYLAMKEFLFYTGFEYVVNCNYCFHVCSPFSLEYNYPDTGGYLTI